MNEKRDITSPITVLYSYAHEDEALRNQLEKHLSTLKRQGFINHWYDRQIIPGTDWSIDIDLHLQTASIILLLVSSDFLASDYIFGAELMEAMKRHIEGTSHVIPIILRPVDWENTPFAHLQVLPSDGKPITTWKNRDEAFLNIARGIRRICEDIKGLRVPQPELFTINSDNIQNPQPSVISTIPSQYSYELYDVFKKSGIPEVTFVKREDFELLILALAQPGRGVVIEGPSGVGKTTSVEKAIKELQLLNQASRYSGSVQILSARNPEHRIKIQTLPQWHQNTVIIDDFHRLEPSLRENLVDYLKYLADTETISQKLVIVGIPQTGQSLVDTSFDIATRIDVFKLGKVKDELILQMIGKGEEALNVRFDRRGEIAIAANGSLNIAQFLCYNICYQEHIRKTQQNLKTIHCNMEVAISNVMQDLSRKFNKLIRRVAVIGGIGESIGLHLIEELSLSEEGYVSLPILKSRKPQLTRKLEQLEREQWLGKFYEQCSNCDQHIFYDQISQALVIDDPQLVFYLKQVHLSSLLREIGANPTIVQQKVFISYSHRDINWLKRLQIHLKVYEHTNEVNNLVDLWDDTKIAVGAQWTQEITEAISTASIAIFLVSADFLASEFIRDIELPKLLDAARSRNLTIISIIVSPCAFELTPLSKFQAANSPKRPLTSLAKHETEEVFATVAKMVYEKFAISSNSFSGDKKSSGN